VNATVKSHVIQILKYDRAIAKHNFAINNLRVWPSAYRDVARAVETGKIRIGTNVGKGNAAEYDARFGVMDVAETLNLLDERDRALVIHEATHAHLDMLTLGKHSGYENEAMGYIAEALYILAVNGRDVGTQSFRQIAKGIAAQVFKGQYGIAQKDVEMLTADIAKQRFYASRPFYVSDGL
jgi:hypothetical protein